MGLDVLAAGSVQQAEQEPRFHGSPALQLPSSIFARVYLPGLYRPTHSFKPLPELHVDAICLFAANRVMNEFPSFHETGFKTSLTSHDNMSTVAGGIEMEQGAIPAR